ncbi:MAG: tRNA (adenosine(37)-N6)-dimethylallyltransferase MiaA [Bacilli bacterium]|nr:tRNA (adenosine(37)-N6)-dimethylallyltransferase MiaA [Bacilli bacterium]
MVIVIAGPTGIGKTKLSIDIAKKIDGEIINADSTQVYKGLDIATAKIREEEKEGIIHHLFDIKTIEENYTVYDYQKDCRMTIDDILKRGKTPILVGGTGLYIKAALYDYNFEKEGTFNDFNDFSNQEILAKINHINSNHDIHVNNRKRLVRKLNKLINNEEDSHNGQRLFYETKFIGLTTDRDLLYDRLNNRVDLMMKQGLLNEAKELYNSNIRTKSVMTPIGYKELFEYFDGNMDLDTSIELIKKRSRNYAKRQYTWFNNQMDIKWVEVNFSDFDKTIIEVLNYIKKSI